MDSLPETCGLPDGKNPGAFAAGVRAKFFQETEDILFRTPSRTPVNSLLLALASTSLAMAGPALASRIFYIDFDGGNDAASGQSPDTAWKHAPGDASATGNPKAHKFQPGDTFRFKGGVRYRSSIYIKSTAAGSKESPVVFDGSSWGDKKAVFDGSNALPPAQHCRSAAQCLNAPNWRNLMYVAIPSTSRWDDWLFSNDTAMMPAQWPSAPFWKYDDVSYYAPVPTGNYAVLAGGYVPVAVPPQLKNGAPVLALWNSANAITRRSQIEITAAGISFTKTFTPNSKNGVNRFAIMNTPFAIDAPGKYAISPADGIAVFYPDSAARLPMSIATHRPGMRLGKTQNIVIRGFSFTNYATYDSEFGNDSINGRPIVATAATDGITILDNNFRSFALMPKEKAITLTNSINVEIKRNTFNWAPYASGVIVQYSKGPVNISCNSFQDLGRDGIVIYGLLKASITGNVMNRLENIHGNGITVYLDNRDILISNNKITNTDRPLTAKWIGSATPDFDPSIPVDIRVRDNVLLSNNPDSAAFSVWGSGLHNVTLRNNILANPKYAIRMTGSWHDIKLINNKVVGKIADGAALITYGNTFYEPDGNGAAVIATASNRNVSTSSCQ